MNTCKSIWCSNTTRNALRETCKKKPAARQSTHKRGLGVTKKTLRCIHFFQCLHGLFCRLNQFRNLSRIVWKKNKYKSLGRRAKGRKTDFTCQRESSPWESFLPPLLDYQERLASSWMMNLWTFSQTRCWSLVPLAYWDLVWETKIVSLILAEKKKMKVHEIRWPPSSL